MAPPSRVVSALSLLTTVLGEADGFLLALACLLSDALVPAVPVVVSDSDCALAEALALGEALALVFVLALAEAVVAEGPSIGVGVAVGLVPVHPAKKNAATANAERCLFMPSSLA